MSLDWRKDMDRRVKAAIANGTHSDKFRPVCQGCSNYCDGYLHKTLDGKMFGECCTPKDVLEKLKKGAT